MMNRRNFCLNPCFSGIVVVLMRHIVNFAAIGLNPCFSGIVVVLR